MSMSVCQPVVIFAKIIAADDVVDVAVQRILSIVPYMINHVSAGDAVVLSYAGTPT